MSYLSSTDVSRASSKEGEMAHRHIIRNLIKPSQRSMELPQRIQQSPISFQVRKRHAIQPPLQVSFVAFLLLASQPKLDSNPVLVQHLLSFHPTSNRNSPLIWPQKLVPILGPLQVHKKIALTASPTTAHGNLSIPVLKRTNKCKS